MFSIISGSLHDKNLPVCVTIDTAKRNFQLLRKSKELTEKMIRLPRLGGVRRMSEPLAVSGIKVVISVVETLKS